MNIGILKWILFGVAALALIVWSIYTFFKRKSEQIKKGENGNKPSSTTCKAPNCGAWFNRIKRDSKYCEFHDEVLKLNIKLNEMDSSFKRKSQMYFSQDARSLSGNQQHNIIEELKKHIKAEEKKNSK